MSETIQTSFQRRDTAVHGIGRSVSDPSITAARVPRLRVDEETPHSGASIENQGLSAGNITHASRAKRSGRPKRERLQYYADESKRVRERKDEVLAHLFEWVPDRKLSKLMPEAREQGRLAHPRDWNVTFLEKLDGVITAARGDRAWFLRKMRRAVEKRRAKAKGGPKELVGQDLDIVIKWLT